MALSADSWRQIPIGPIVVQPVDLRIFAGVSPNQPLESVRRRNTMLLLLRFTLSARPGFNQLARRVRGASLHVMLHFGEDPGAQPPRGMARPSGSFTERAAKAKKRRLIRSLRSTLRKRVQRPRRRA